MKRVLLFGTFDKLHLGHRFVIDQAIKRGEVFIVVGRDKTVLKIKDKTVPFAHLRMEPVDFISQQFLQSHQVQLEFFFQLFRYQF